MNVCHEQTLTDESCSYSVDCCSHRRLIPQNVCNLQYESHCNIAKRKYQNNLYKSTGDFKYDSGHDIIVVFNTYSQTSSGTSDHKTNWQQAKTHWYYLHHVVIRWTPTNTIVPATGYTLTFGKSLMWFASKNSSSKLLEYRKISSGTVGNEQCRLSTHSTWRLHLNKGIHRNMLDTTL